MEMDDPLGTSTTPPAQKAMIKYQRIFQTALDKSVIYPHQRWGGFGVLLLLYLLRVYLLRGFYIVTYALGIYILNLFIGFLSPAIDPEEADDDGPMLPTGNSPLDGGEEFRPFSRKLPEFKFWVASTRAVLMAIGATFFEMFDLPVFWPILLAYFIILVLITMKERVKHMIKYKYVPFSWGKTTYRDLTKTPAGGLQQGMPAMGEKAK